MKARTDLPVQLAIYGTLYVVVATAVHATIVLPAEGFGRGWGPDRDVT